MDYDDYDEDYDEDQAFISDSRRKNRRVNHEKSPYQPRQKAAASGSKIIRNIGIVIFIIFLFAMHKLNANSNNDEKNGDKGNLRDPSKDTNSDMYKFHDDKFKSYPDDDGDYASESKDGSSEYDDDDDTDDKLKNILSKEEGDDDSVDDDDGADDNGNALDDDKGNDDDDSEEYDDDDSEEHDDDATEEEEYDDDDNDNTDGDGDDDDDEQEYDDDDDDEVNAIEDDAVDDAAADDDDDAVDDKSVEYDDDDDTTDDKDAEYDDDDDITDDKDVEYDDDNNDNENTDGDDDDVAGDDDKNVEYDADDADDNTIDDKSVEYDDDDDDNNNKNTDDDDDDDKNIEYDDDDDEEGTVTEDDDEDDDNADNAEDDDDYEEGNNVGDNGDEYSSPLMNMDVSTLPDYHIRNKIKKRFHKWDDELRHIVEMDKYQGGEPKVNWDWHPKKRKDRFPSVEERVKYYMGEWYDRSIPMYGDEFRKNTFLYRKMTRECDLCSRLVVNVFDLDPDAILDMYASGESRYKQGGDFVDLSILHQDSSTQVMMNWGDNIPKAKYTADKIYPVFCKVRHYCEKKESWGDYENSLCNQKQISTIIWPVNHRRLHSLPFITPDNDIPWEEKEGKAMWRGGAPEEGPPEADEEFDPMETRHIKWKLISEFVGHPLVDAKYTRRDFKGFAEKGLFKPEYIAPRTEMDEQLKYKYMIAIEGNDVSSAIKWMLFSNSVVLSPPFRFDSWSMECFLEPFVHYIPLKTDLSDLIERIEWAESNPDEARKISERATLFVYDLLMSDDAINENQLVLEGIMERYERNFGYSSRMEVIHPVSHIHSEWHPKRKYRFPSVETRIEYYMGIWYDENKPSMKRSKFSAKAAHVEKGDKITEDTALMASGFSLTECASDNGHDLREFCEDALPDFDEREMEIARTVVMDDTVKVIQFGNLTVDSDDLPVFGKTRKASERKDQGRAILWPFEYKKEFSVVESGLIEECETPFASKIPKAIWRGSEGTLGRKSKSDEYKSRLKLVRNSVSGSSEKIDAKFLTTKERFQSKEDPKNFPREGFAVEPTSDNERRDYFKDILSHRYIIATEDDYKVNSDLKWMLLSQSVVLMAEENRFSSWFMEDFLEPYVHYIPISKDYSDVEEKLKWCEKNPEKAEEVSERATLFVHDMLFHYSSDTEYSEIKFQLMEKYSENFG